MNAAQWRITDSRVWIQAIKVALISFAACFLYSVASSFFIGVTPTPLEFLGTLASLWCVILVRFQNILNWPIGIIGSLLMGIFFWQIDVVGQAGLQLLFFVPIQFWCWYQWIDRSPVPRIQIPVTKLSLRGWWRVGALYVIGAFVMANLISTQPNAVYALWDGSIVAASMIAQFLLAWKKPASWLMWMIPVNVASIALFIATGAYMFAALYVVFLVNALLADLEWLKELRQKRVTVVTAND